MLQPSARIIVGDVAATGSGSYLGGMPRMPAGIEWPRWDRRASLERQALDFEAKSQANPKATRLRDIAAKMREDMNAGPAPLGFLGQVSLREVALRPHWRAGPRMAGSLSFSTRVKGDGAMIRCIGAPPSARFRAG